MTDMPPTENRQTIRDERRLERDQRDSGWNAAPIGGLIVIAVGVIFLLGNFGLDLPPRWWAIFILVPAAASLVSAVRLYNVDGRLSSRAGGAATGGVLMLAVALILYLDLDWGKFWPVLVIIVGVGIVARGMWRR
jgi:hypothetical protein